ncbi:MAG: endonuclease III domain-containing protein [Candidatus Saganbacteria bacterium]|nr:endonuclease III domain-containing protein [Candidatus Saganbacteria bacterium]
MSKLKQIYNKLCKHFGPQYWWPGDSPFEVVVGAILTQSCNWQNVELAISNLKKEKILSIKELYNVKTSKLQKLVKPSGYFRAKAKKLKAFVYHLIKYHKGSLKIMFKQPLSKLREELLSIHGIGPETADSILLYAAEKPSFVVDAYTIRIGQRLKLFKRSKYNEVKEFFESNLQKDVKLFNEFHALLVALGKDYCKKSRPKCDICPLLKICQ